MRVPNTLQTLRLDLFQGLAAGNPCAATQHSCTPHTNPPFAVWFARTAHDSCPRIYLLTHLRITRSRRDREQVLKEPLKNGSQFKAKIGEEAEFMHIINEHFLMPTFNAEMATQIVLQRFLSRL